LADDEGLVALGGDFSVARLVAGYRRGVFPWSVNPITWWSPNPRGIIELDELHISRSLCRVLRSGAFTVTLDHNFRGVMTACAQPASGRKSTWITAEFINAYEELHQAGHAHSLEVWKDSQMVGGIYGVCQGGLFAGESMFHQVSNASKVALVRLVEHLRQRRFVLFDVQMLTPVTRQMGAVEISRDDYLQRLARALKRKCSFV
jgi:leucyl/phenylalanyl-tRNA--protein transferase